MVLIVGAGLAGLSTAYHLHRAGTDLSYWIVEKEGNVGGLCRSVQQGGVTIDVIGHLLHFRQPSIKTLVLELLGGRVTRHARRSYVYSHRTLTEYPFQVHTQGLPPDIVRDCVLGFIEAHCSPESTEVRHLSFPDWVLATFGEGFARHFFFPFNEKLWRISLDELTSDWVSWLIPRPDLRDVVNGALGVQEKAFGYNASFLYPSDGGIARVAEAFLPHINEVALNKEVVEIDTRRQCVWFSDGTEAFYERMVSTIPLPHLISRCAGLPEWMREAAHGLRATSIYALNMVIEREDVGDMHWIYFPEPEFPFYRVGFPGTYAIGCRRQGLCPLAVEVSHRADEPWSNDALIADVTRGLERAGLIARGEPILTWTVRDVEGGYVIFDKHRARSVPELLRELEARSIFSIGRYGRWEHSSMENAIRQGKDAAELLASGSFPKERTTIGRVRSR